MLKLIGGLMSCEHGLTIICSVAFYLVKTPDPVCHRTVPRMVKYHEPANRIKECTHVIMLLMYDISVVTFALYCIIKVLKYLGCLCYISA